jgi:hypothetical protein
MPSLLDQPAASLDAVAHVIQMALTPVFLLSAIATLLNVFSTRLARVADKVEQVTKAIEAADGEEALALSAQLTQLHRRSLALDWAVVLGGVGGAATCCAVLTLFVSELRDASVAWTLFALFGFAVLCAIGALAAFTVEMLISGGMIRFAVAAGRRSAEEQDPG